MYRQFMHAWERRCHDKDLHSRVVRPFEWGLEHLNGQLPRNGHTPLAALKKFNEQILANSHEFYTPAPSRSDDFDFDGFMLRFPSSIATASPANNIVHARFYPALRNGQPSDRVRKAKGWVGMRLLGPGSPGSDDQPLPNEGANSR